MLAHLALAILTLQVLAGSMPVKSADAGTVTPIKHVVIIMMENHSFDNIFGLYPNTNQTVQGSLATTLQKPDDVLNVPSGVSLSQVPKGTYATADPAEGVYVGDWDNGKMDGFATYGGSQAMTYYGPSQIAVEWDWAEQYAVADRYFSSCLCMTNPNRLFSLAGYGAGLTDDSGPPPYVPVNQTIFGELNRFGVSWGYYFNDPAIDNFPLNYFDGIGTYSSQIQSTDTFYGALQQGTLPAVSWVMPVGGGSGAISQHPEDNMTVGEAWLLGVVDRVMQSSYWNSSAIFITYDEGGGYYEHVAPPIVDGVQLGFRVPLFIISPYAKENYVSQTVMNHASSLAFIDYNWKLPPLNSYVASSGLPLDMFNFNQSYQNGSLVRAPVILQINSGYPTSLQIPLASLPYQRTGSYSATLSSMGAIVYIATNTSTTPVFQSLPFAALAAVGLLVAGYYAARRSRKDRAVKRVE